MKKLLSVLLASAITISAVGGLAACKKSAKEDEHEIIVWAPDAAKATYEKLADDFLKSDPTKYGDYTVTVISKDEGDVESSLTSDAAMGADVFFFPGGHVNDMLKKKHLLKATAAQTTAIKANNAANTVTPILVNDEAYAFPATSDNGYFLWYRKDVLSATDVETLDGIVSVAKNKNKNIMFEYGNGWYAPSFWFGMGCKLDYDTDGNYTTTIDNADGKKAMQAWYNYLNPTDNKMKNTQQLIVKANNDQNGEYATNLANGTACAAVIGTWIADDLKLKLAKAEGVVASSVTSLSSLDADTKDAVDDLFEEKIGAAKLPTFTCDGQQVQMGSFSAGKYCGVNNLRAYDAKKAVALELAAYFTGETGQSLRYQNTSAIPSNKNLQESDAVASDFIVQAFLAQNAVGGYLEQNHKTEMWDLMGGIGNSIVAGTTTADGLDAALTSVANALRAD
ncbi:MAG: extracellular solute-binding protein [Roseburia sp.]|nr:extracellular solute-binding protein [Roseburia sp.]